MSRRSLLLPLLPLALALASCGGDTPSGTSVAEAPAPRAAAPAGGGEGLVVGGTDLRLGGAQTDDGSGPQRLAGGSRPDPDSLRREADRREGVGAGAACPDQDLQPTPGNLDAVVASTLCLLNGERADAGLGPLEQDGQLAQAAIRHSRDMVANAYFAHDGRDGSSSTDRIRASGYIPSDRAWTVGENLAWGTGELATPRNIVIAWMNSKGHRENVLRPAFNQIGFGVVTGNPKRGDGGGATYTTTFGSLGGGDDAAAAAPTTAAAAAPSEGRRASSRVRSAVKGRKARRAKSRRAKARSARAAKAARARAAKARAAKADKRR